MTFPPDISKIFRVIIIVALAWNVAYTLNDDLEKLDKLYIALLKISICFTAFISYLNEGQKMLRISEKGLLFENIEVLVKRPQWRFFFIIIIILYNPILPIFNSKVMSLVIDAVTIIFFGFKSDFSKSKKILN